MFKGGALKEVADSAGLTVHHCTEPFIIILPSSRSDLNTVERDVKTKSVEVSGWQSG